MVLPRGERLSGEIDLPEEPENASGTGSERTRVDPVDLPAPRTGGRPQSTSSAKNAGWGWRSHVRQRRARRRVLKLMKRLYVGFPECFLNGFPARFERAGIRIREPGA